MRTFAVTALFAVAANAQYSDFKITQDGSTTTKYFRSQDWSTAPLDENDSRVKVNENNSILLKNQEYEGYSYAYKPYVRGGAIQYTVDLSNHGCGCVAGVYAVAMKPGCNGEEMQPNDISNGSMPSCPSIDVMQANPYGFNVAAHPCKNGNCDAVSMCNYDMIVQGEATYGKGAYGPNGTMINTNQPFDVKTEFVSDPSYANLHKIRTRITQNTQEIMMEASCADYLEDINTDIEGGMGFVISSWDNTDGGYDVGECPTSCTTPATSCASAINQISDFRVFQWGYTEDPATPPTPPTPPTPNPDDDDSSADDDVPTPSPEPATFEMFIGQSTQMGGPHNFYLKGLDGSYLETESDTIKMGLDNKAFVLDYAYDDSEYWSYWHDYLGGTLYFDVDVSSVDCECAAGVFLVELDAANNCGWEQKQLGETPQCASIDVMEANKSGFRTQSLPCEFGVCDVTSQCSASANASDNSNYGAGSQYKINTENKYTVKTQFLKKDDSLECIRTTLIQGTTEHAFDQDCRDYMDPLSFKLQKMMAMGISTYHLGLTNDVSSQTCTAECSNLDTKSVISNVRWTTDDAFADDTDNNNDNATGDIVVGGPAPALNSGICGNDCSQCMEHFVDTDPTNTWYECVDWTIYRFGNKCKDNHDKSKCMTDSGAYCHKSYPYGDADKFRSDDMACRTVPDEYVTGNMNFARRKTRNQSCGLCTYGCGGGECFRSWLSDDGDRWRGASAMCRCKP